MCYGRTTPVIELVVLSARERGEWRVGEGAELVQDLSSHRVLRDLGGKAGETGVSARLCRRGGRETLGRAREAAPRDRPRAPGREAQAPPLPRNRAQVACPGAGASMFVRRNPSAVTEDAGQGRQALPGPRSDAWRTTEDSRSLS